MRSPNSAIWTAHCLLVTGWTLLSLSSSPPPLERGHTPSDDIWQRGRVHVWWGTVTFGLAPLAAGRAADVSLCLGAVDLLAYVPAAQFRGHVGSGVWCTSRPVGDGRPQWAHWCGLGEKTGTAGRQCCF